MFNRRNKILWVTIVVLMIISIASLGVAISNSSGSSSSSLKDFISLRVSGSSTIYPIWKNAQDDILKKFNVALEIDSTGSGNGVRSSYEKKTHFGNTSRDPKISEVNDAGDAWNTIKTVKLAIDAIVMFAKIPPSCSSTTSFTSSPKHIIKAYTGLTDNQLQLISNSSGEVEVNNGIIKKGQVSITIPSSKPILKDLFETQCNDTITLFTRNTTASGTRDGFLQIVKLASKYDQNLNWLTENVFSDIIEERVEMNSLSTTNEANSSAEQAIKASSSGASYISYGFVNDLKSTKNNEELIVSNIKFNQNTINPNVENILNNQYEWKRNLNTLIDTESIYIDRIVEILDFFRVSFNGRKVIKENGFVPIAFNESIINYKLPDRVIREFDPNLVPWIE